MTRLIRRVRIGRSSITKLENLDNEQDLDDLDEDPRKLGRMMRELSRESGEDLGPEFDEVIDRLERGENPEDIAQSLPDEPEDSVDE